LWHKENPEKLKAIGKTDKWIAPIDIAKEMITLCEDWTTVPSGSVLEVVAKDSTRVVELLNDPGPAIWGKRTNPKLDDNVLQMLEEDKKH
jgi:hypothetical protein